MALSIKDPEADRLVRELAAETGESITEAARKAFEERLRRVRARRAAAERVVTLDDVILRARALPVVDARPADDIIGYDDAGLPA